MLNSEIKRYDKKVLPIVPCRYSCMLYNVADIHLKLH